MTLRFYFSTHFQDIPIAIWWGEEELGQDCTEAECQDSSGEEQQIQTPWGAWSQTSAVTSLELVLTFKTRRAPWSFFSSSFQRNLDCALGCAAFGPKMAFSNQMATMWPRKLVPLCRNSINTHVWSGRHRLLCSQNSGIQGRWFQLVIPVWNSATVYVNEMINFFLSYRMQFAHNDENIVWTVCKRWQSNSKCIKTYFFFPVLISAFSQVDINHIPMSCQISRWDTLGSRGIPTNPIGIPISIPSGYCVGIPTYPVGIPMG